MQPDRRQTGRRYADRRTADRRREPRFETSLWVGIPEAEGEPELETCNISAGGLLLRTPRDAGAPGSVRMLRLVTGDLGAEIEIMARVVRVEAIEDAEFGRLLEATSFEFLPHQPQELEAFLREVIEGEIAVVKSSRSDCPSASVQSSTKASLLRRNPKSQPADRLKSQILNPKS